MAIKMKIMRIILRKLQVVFYQQQNNQQDNNLDKNF